MALTSTITTTVVTSGTDQSGAAEAANFSVAQTNSNAPHQLQQIQLLASTPTSIGIPTGTQVIVLIPPSNATGALTAGTQGISVTGPTYINVTGIVSPSLTLTSTAGMTLRVLFE